MEISEFAPLTEIDPLYYDASYYAVPEKAGQKAFGLLVRTLEQARKVALATVVMHQREYAIAVRRREHGLTLHTLYFADEIRDLPDHGRAEANPTGEEIKLARELVDKLTTHFKPEKYKDEFQAKLQQLLHARSKGKKVSVASDRKLAPVIDIRSALQKSLESSRAASIKVKRSGHRSPIGKARRMAG